MPATVLQINTSHGGVPKRPIAEGFVTPLGIEGDLCAHPAIHGGPEQALLLIAREAVDELSGNGYALYYGALGENITTDGLDRKSLRSGQRYRIGSEVIIELTRLRAPCNTLDTYDPLLKNELWDRKLKAGDASSPRWARAGFYARVIQTGSIRPGAPVVLLGEDA